jgi:hypothetical protein
MTFTTAAAFECRSSLGPDDLGSFNEMDGSGAHPAIGEGGKERSWHQRLTHGRSLEHLRSFPPRVSVSKCHQTSFVSDGTKAGDMSKGRDGSMLPIKCNTLPSRKDDRVLLHFDCRYINLHRTTCNMQLADTAIQR